MNCGICFDIIKKSVNGNCNHHYCYDCLINWLKTKNNCPKCNNILSEINYDKEYDEIVLEYKNLLNKFEISQELNNTNENFNNENENINEEKKLFLNNITEKKITIDFNNHHNEDMGITIINNCNGPGIKISKIIKNKIASLYNIKKGDVILFINNIPCINHKQSMEILQNLSLSYKKCELLFL